MFDSDFDSYDRDVDFNMHTEGREDYDREDFGPEEFDEREYDEEERWYDREDQHLDGMYEE